MATSQFRLDVDAALKFAKLKVGLCNNVYNDKTKMHRRIKYSHLKASTKQLTMIRCNLVEKYPDVEVYHVKAYNRADQQYYNGGLCIKIPL